MAQPYPLNPAMCPQGLSHAIETVPNDTVNALNPDLCQGMDQVVCDVFYFHAPPPWSDCCFRCYPALALLRSGPALPDRHQHHAADQFRTSGSCAVAAVTSPVPSTALQSIAATIAGQYRRPWM